MADSTIFGDGVPDGAAPALTDYVPIGQSPSGETPSFVRQTLASIRNLFMGAPTAAGDFPVSIDGVNYVKRTLAQTKTILGVAVKVREGTISNPQAVYAQRPQIYIGESLAAQTVTGIYIDTFQAGQELAGDLKYADDADTGGFANDVVIDVIDTTSGKFSATSGFDDATIPAGKKIYLQLDSSPHADIKDFSVLILYTYD
jgi:hypothetical protein